MADVLPALSRGGDLAEWLSVVARQLRAGRPHANVPALCRELGFAIQQRPQRARTDGSYAEPRGVPTITLYRSSPVDAPLTGRQMFTLAHELGHALIVRWFPERSALRVSGRLDMATGAAVRRAEERLVDDFASRLLVAEPDVAAAGLGYADRSDTALRALLFVRARCGVSLEVAARRIVQESPMPGIAVTAVRRTDPTARWMHQRGLPRNLISAMTNALSGDSDPELWDVEVATRRVAGWRVATIVAPDACD